MIQNPNQELDELEPVHRESNMKLSQLESRIDSIEELGRVQGSMMEIRFNELDRRLERLTDHLFSIVPEREPEPTVQAQPTVNPQPMAGSQKSPNSRPSFQDDKIVSEWAKIEGLRPTPSMLVDEASDQVDVEALTSEPTMDTIEATEPTEATATRLEAQAVPEPERESAPELEKQKQESVADLLARLKTEGQWDGVEDNEGPLEPAAIEPTRAPEPPPVQQPVHAVENPHPAPTSQPSGDEDDVEDYMAQLLSRMRGDSEPAPTPAAEAQPPPSEPAPSAPAAPVGSSQPLAAVEHPEVMRAEDYVPQQKAKKIQSLDKMRELANSTARNAVASSEEQRQQALAYVQLAIGIAALIMSAYYFGFLMKSIGDTSCIVGVVCLGLAGFLGHRFYTTINSRAEE